MDGLNGVRTYMYVHMSGILKCLFILLLSISIVIFNLCFEGEIPFRISPALYLCAFIGKKIFNICIFNVHVFYKTKDLGMSIDSLIIIKLTD